MFEFNAQCKGIWLRKVCEAAEKFQNLTHTSNLKARTLDLKYKFSLSNLLLLLNLFDRLIRQSR